MYNLAAHQHPIPSHTTSTQVSTQNITAQQPPGGASGPPMSHGPPAGHPPAQSQQFFSGPTQTPPQPVQDRSVPVQETMASTIAGNI